MTTQQMKNITGLTLLILTLLFCSQCKQNRKILSSIDIGPDSSVFAMAVYNDELYIGGRFDSVSGFKSKYIAKWDGTKWSAVGKGLSEGTRGVEALEVYKGELYAAGDFNYIDTIPVDHIAKWNGNEWSPVGHGKTDGVLPYIRSLCIYKDELYAASAFHSIGGVKAKNIAKWDGVKWDSVGVGVNYTIISLAVYKDELYAGGICDRESGNLVKWDGSKWTSLGKGISTNDEVQSYAIYQNNLITAGTFDSAGGQAANVIAKWDGEVFKPFDKPLTDSNASMATMTVYNDELYVGGWFSFPNKENSNVNIIKWDGNSWQMVAKGASNQVSFVSCFINYKNDFYAGGSFRSLNGRPVKFLTKLPIPITE